MTDDPVGQAESSASTRWVTRPTAKRAWRDLRPNAQNPPTTSAVFAPPAQSSNPHSTATFAGSSDPACRRRFHLNGIERALIPNDTYAWELNSGMPTAGINLLWLLAAVVIDLGGLGSGAHRQSRR